MILKSKIIIINSFFKRKKYNNSKNNTLLGFKLGEVNAHGVCANATNKQ